MENFQDRGVWIRIRFVLRGWIRIRFVLGGWIRIRIRSISDRIRNPAHQALPQNSTFSNLHLHFRPNFLYKSIHICMISRWSFLQKGNKTKLENNKQNIDNLVAQLLFFLPKTFFEVHMYRNIELTLCVHEKIIQKHV